MNVRFRFLLACIATVPFFGPGYTADSTCVGDALDWYTSVVGESPCMTYQRLRQICNSEYEVAAFRPNTPGDNCNDQLSSCCCNSISWALSMLCMNCQQDVNGGDVNGIDAGVGAYEMYLDGCGYGTNQSLPTNIQAAVCNVGIRLDDFLYGLFWNNGAWYYTYTREAAEQDHATNDNNTFTHCESDITTSSTSKSSTSTQTTATTSSATTKSVLTTSQSAAPTSQVGTSTSQAGTSTSQTGTPTNQFGIFTSQGSTVTGKAPGTSSATGHDDTHNITVTTSAATTETMLTTGPFGMSTIQVTTVTGVAIGISTATAHSDTHSVAGAVVGGAVGGGVALIALLIGTCLIWRRRHRKDIKEPAGYVENDIGTGSGVISTSVSVLPSMRQSTATTSERTFNGTHRPMSAPHSSTSESLLKDYPSDLHQGDSLNGHGSMSEDADGRPLSWSRPFHLSTEPLIHDDAGPLEDSFSGTGSLPPPYQHSWNAE